MKRLVAMFVIVCLLAGMSVLPTAAQDESADPVPCTADEVKQVADLALPFGDQLNTVASGNYDQTLDGDISKMLDWGDLYVSFFNDLYPELPSCIDGVMYGDAVGLLLNRQMTLEAMIVLSDEQIATNSVDSDVDKAMTDALQIQSAFAKQGVSGVNNIVNQVKEGTATPSWVHACSADELQFTTQLDNVEEAYGIIVPYLQDYLDGGSVDKNIYIGSLQIVTALDVAINNLPVVCADYYWRLANDIYNYGDTLTTLTLGQIAPYITEGDNADRFNTLLGYCNDGLSSYVDRLTATATPEA